MTSTCEKSVRSISMTANPNIMKVLAILVALAFFLPAYAASAGEKLYVRFDVKVDESEHSRIRLRGKTNLPDGMELMIMLSSEDTHYMGQDPVRIKDGRFKSAWFSQEGRSLDSGEYEISVSSPRADLEPKHVQRIIGEKGRNLRGKHIKKNGGWGRHLDFERTVEIE